MEICKGLKDWFFCLKCPYLCTKMCPLESENVMEEMKKHMHQLSSLQGSHKKEKIFNDFEP